MGFSMWICKFCKNGFGWSSHDLSFVGAGHQEGCRGANMKHEDYAVSIEDFLKEQYPKPAITDFS